MYQPFLNFCFGFQVSLTKLWINGIMKGLEVSTYVHYDFDSGIKFQFSIKL